MCACMGLAQARSNYIVHAVQHAAIRGSNNNYINVLLTLGRRVTVVVWSFIHSFIHSVTWNCVHFYATTKARTRSPREYIAI